VSAEAILSAVCRWHNVEPGELFSHAISRHGVLLRSLVAWHVLGSGAGNVAQVARWFGVRRWTLRAGIERHRANSPDLFNVPLDQILSGVMSPGRDTQPASAENLEERLNPSLDHSSVPGSQIVPTRSLSPRRDLTPRRR
jgi:hypothetical protein